MSAIIGRFAPTPSGRMHLGNAYAMLAAWLSARTSNGRILLRIEDIDQPRVRPDADRWIMDDLHWLGLDWDGEPVYQSQRLDRYEEALRVLRGCDMRSSDSLLLVQDDVRRRAVIRNASSFGILGDAACESSPHAVLSETAREAHSSVTLNATAHGMTAHEMSSSPVALNDAARGGSSLVGLSASASTEKLKNPVASPLIYPCFCSRAEIRAASAPQEGDGFVRYPGTCRRLDSPERSARLNRGDRHSWRIAVPVGTVRFDDRVFGPQHVDLARELGDTVVRRSDGIFSYQLAVTVDDLEMGVTDVVRGRDLLRSTALQMWIRANLLAAGFGMVAQSAPNHPNQDGGTRDDVADMRAGDAFPSSSAQSSMPSIDDLADNGVAFSQALEVSAQADDARPTSAQPAYAHLPLIDDATGKRLAKRDRALDLGVLRDQGVTPEQVVGRCAWWLGLQVDAAGTPLPEPVPMSAADALDAFSWNRVRAAHDRDHGDYRMR